MNHRCKRAAPGLSGPSRRLSPVVCLLLASFATPDPAAAERIVYIAEQEAAYLPELWLVDLAEPGKTTRLNKALAPFANGVGSFTVAPDGSRLAYSADQDAIGDTDMFLVDIAAPGKWTQVGDLPAGHQELRAKFSPDGSRLAFTASDENYGNVQLYLVDVASPSQSVRLNGDLVEYGSVSMTGFAFTGDGLRVVYVAAEQQSFFELYSVDIDAPGRSTRLNGPGGSVGDTYEGRFVILPDNAGVVYSAVGDTAGVRELHLVAFEAPAQPVTLNAPLQMNGDILDFAMDPEGRRAVYVADQETDSKAEVYLVDLHQPGAATKLSGDVQSGAWAAAFTPDGRYVIYSGDEERAPGARDLYRVAVDQPTDRSRVNAVPGDSADAGRYTLNADGTLLAYAPDPPGGFPRDLMVVAPGAPGGDIRVNGPLTHGSLEFLSPEFSPEGDAIAFLAVESLDDSVQELFFARVSEPGVSVRLNPPLPPGAIVSPQPDAFAFLPAGAPPTGEVPPGGQPPPGGVPGTEGGGGACGLPVLLLLVCLARGRRPEGGQRPVPAL